MDLHAVDCDYAHRLATMLECALLNRLGSWDEGHALLDEYRAACRAVMPDAPTFMGEPVIHAVDLVEIDGHVYGLRPGAARIVREALRDAARLSHVEKYVHFEFHKHMDTDAPWVKVWSFAGPLAWMYTGDTFRSAIDAAMAKDGA